MDDAAQLLSTLARAYGAQGASSNLSLPITKVVSPIRVSASPCNTFENLLLATRDVGHELVSVLASKVAMERVVDQFPCGLILVTADLKVLSANKSAQQLLDSSNGMTLVEQRLVCMDGRSQRKLEHCIERLYTTAKSVIRSGAVRIVRGNGSADLQLRIGTLDGLCQLPPAMTVPAYCIWVFEPSAYKTIDGDLLRDLHGLTASEATVTAALFRGLSIDEVASELDVSINTIKTHLKHIFQKCEVRSQAELLQMLALGPR